jgi:TusA-related sulfurtransferase
MCSTMELDLRGVGLPVCLLKCQSTLVGMEPGVALDVLVRDPEVVADLVRIGRRSQDRIIKTHKERDYFRIHFGPASNRSP